LLPHDHEVVASGGALLRSPAWLQIIADVLGRPVALSQVREASARGVALLVSEALGLLDDLAEAPPCIGRQIEPDPERHARYTEARQRQQRLYRRLIREGDEATDR
jgi:gluconokinase